jgi:hypothetical protein
MKSGRAAAAIGTLLVTTVSAEGTSLFIAPLRTLLASQRPSPAGNLISLLIANAATSVPALVAPAANVSALPQTTGQTCRAT